MDTIRLFSFKQNKQMVLYPRMYERIYIRPFQLYHYIRSKKYRSQNSCGNNNNNPNNHNRVPCHEHAQLPLQRWLNGRQVKTEARGRILFTYRKRCVHILYYISERIRVCTLVCILYIHVFLHFFPRSIYPSFLTHIVVETCLQDRCCVHPPERDLSDFGRKKIFSYSYVHVPEFTKVQITIYFIQVQLH